METLVAFGIAFLITLYFVRGYLKKLTRGKQAAAAPAPAVTRPCPRCASPVQQGSAFCPACGAPLALWTVQSASVSTGSSNGSAPGVLRPVINASLCIGCGTCVEACPEQGTLELVGGKAILAHPERCKAHATCVSACPTSGISMSADGALRTIRVPLVSPSFETNVPGLYIIGELGGMGLIKTSINEGRLAADHLVQRLACEGRAPEGAYDVIVVGAGPAGLSASLTLHQHEIRYLTLEQGEVAATIRNYPRHKFLMAEPLEMPLYGNLYIADSTKESLLQVWESIIANTGVRIQTNEKVEAINRRSDTGLLAVRTHKDEYLARFVVLGIGKRGSPRRLGVPGEELSHVAYRIIEVDTYKDADLLVVGGGDSAIEAALGLAKGGRNRVTLAHRSADFSRARERNRASLEAAEKEDRIRILLQTQVREITQSGVSLDSAGSPLNIKADYVFILAGGESPEDFLRKSGVEIVEKEIAA